MLNPDRLRKDSQENERFYEKVLNKLKNWNSLQKTPYKDMAIETSFVISRIDYIPHFEKKIKDIVEYNFYQRWYEGMIPDFVENGGQSFYSLPKAAIEIIAQSIIIYFEECGFEIRRKNKGYHVGFDISWEKPIQDKNNPFF